MEDITPTDPAQFNDCLFHLLYYKARTNGFNVPRDDLPKLHAFLQHLKKEYKHYMVKMGEDPSEPNPDEFPPSVLTPQQVAVLESLHIPVTSRGDEHWLRFFSLLEDWKKEHGHVLVPRLCEVPGLGDWVTDQRRQYKSWKQGYPSQLTEFRRNRLESLGFAWSVRDRPEWDTRFKVRMLVWTRALFFCPVVGSFSILLAGAHGLQSEARRLQSSPALSREPVIGYVIRSEAHCSIVTSRCRATNILFCL
jgi:Helicase associated domain